jgi:hypothetical protein
MRKRALGPVIAWMLSDGEDGLMWIGYRPGFV